MNSDVLEQARKTIIRRGLADSDMPVLLMVSGGSDSTALAYLAGELHAHGLVGTLAMVHVNHQLRGEHADADARFVAQLAELLDMPLFSCAVDVAQEARRSGDNIEAVARRERYLAANEALASLCRHAVVPLSGGRIFTAHTADDRIESFYMRSIVGTGPGGFRSMRYRNGPVARPLMDVSREALRDFIIERERAGDPVARDEDGKVWREDATNAHTDRFRAYVRHEIIPRVKERNPQLIDTLCRTMNLIADEDDMLEAQAARLREHSVTWLVATDALGVDHGAGCVFMPDFAQEPLPLQRRACMQALALILGPEARVETSSIDGVLDGFADGAPICGYINNIQGDLAVSANKRGVRIEPMVAYRTRRKKM